MAKNPVSHFCSNPPTFQPDAWLSVFKARRVACGRLLYIYPVSQPGWVTSDWSGVTCKKCLKWLEKTKV